MSFNALKYVEELEQAGFTDEQAKAQIRILQEVVESDLATKRDIRELERDIRELELRITERMTAMELTLTKRVGLIIVSTATVLFGGLVAVMKFFSPQ